jgi:hypothetical protein
MRYYIFAVIAAVFVVMYVWQNIEVMRIKMSYDATLAKEMKLRYRNDRLRYEIEKYRRMDVIAAYARTAALRPVTPGDFEVMEAKKIDGNLK